MKIESLNNEINFKVKINPKFADNAERYYLERGLVLQYDSFKKQVNKLDMLGEDSSEILHYYKKSKRGNVTHMLCLKNELINKKEAVIMFTSNKYNEILRFFNKINEKNIFDVEEYLRFDFNV